MPQSSSDININHPLIRHLPQFCLPYAALIRLDRPVGTYLAFCPALMGLNLALFYAPEKQDKLLFWLSMTVIFFLGAWLMRSAGCVWNDWLDRDLDRHVARTQNRPIASGQISPRSALFFLMLLLALAAVLLFLLPIVVFWAALAIVPTVLLYPMMKRWIDAPQLWLGLSFNSGVWVAWLSVHGTDNLLPPLLLYLGCVFWTVGYDTVYALQDIVDDQRMGIKSFARFLFPNEVFGICATYFLSCIFWSMLIYVMLIFDGQGDGGILIRSPIIYVFSWLLLIYCGSKWYRRYASFKEQMNRDTVGFCDPNIDQGIGFHGIFFKQNALFGFVLSLVWI